MPTFQIGGLASGLDTTQLIEQLMSLERQPVVRLQQRQLQAQAQGEAWRDVRTRLTNLLNKLGDLRQANTFTGKRVTSSAEGVATATATLEAANASYQVEVVQLATPQRNVSGRFTGTEEQPFSVRESLGLSGTFTINDTEIEIGDEDSLMAVMGKINESKAGVRASIVNNQLIITGTASGEFTLADDGSGLLAGLKLTGETGMDVRDGIAAQVYIEGQLVTSATNTIKDVIPGVTINLKGAGEGTTTLTVANDTDKALKAVREFVEQYNSTFTFLGSQADRKTGNLAGESALMQIQSRLRQTVGSAIEGLPEGLKMLAQVGITTGKIGTGVDATGRLEIDEAKFREALVADPEGVADLFKGLGDILKGDLENLTRSTTGVITGREQAAKERVADLKKQIERFEDRLKMKEEGLVRQFTALEKMLGQANNQGAWLQGQLGYLAGGWGWQQK